MSISIKVVPNKLSTIIIHACGLLVVTIMVTKRPCMDNYYNINTESGSKVTFIGDVQRGIELRVDLLLR